MLGCVLPSATGTTPLASQPADWFASIARFACSRSIVTRWPADVGCEEREDGDGRVERRDDVDDRDAGLRRHAGRAGDAHQAADRLHERVVARQVAPGTLAEAADLAVDDGHVLGRDPRVVELEAIERARLEVGDDDVGALAELTSEREVTGVLEIEHDRALVAVGRVVSTTRALGGVPQAVASCGVVAGSARPVDHVGPEVADVIAASGPASTREKSTTEQRVERAHSAKTANAVNRSMTTTLTGDDKPDRPKRAAWLQSTPAAVSSFN